jgi:hypothetical protein
LITAKAIGEHDQDRIGSLLKMVQAVGGLGCSLAQAVGITLAGTRTYLDCRTSQGPQHKGIGHRTTWGDFTRCCATNHLRMGKGPMELLGYRRQIKIWRKQGHDQLGILGALQRLQCLLKGLAGVF